MLLALTTARQLCETNSDSVLNRKCYKKKGINIEDCKLEDLLPDDGAPGSNPDGEITRI